MSAWRLVLQGVRHYWRSHLWLVLGVALASAILTGSLLVGDSVRATLANLAAARTGAVEVALVGGDRMFAEALAANAGGGAGGAAAPVLLVPGTAADDAGERRANGVNVIGVDDRFWSFGGAGVPPEGWAGERALAVNRVLARRLGVSAGDPALVRAEKPTALSRDAALSGPTDDSATSIAVRAEVVAVVDDEHFGAFSLRNEQAGAPNVFLPLGFLQDRLEQPGRANLILVRGGGSAEDVARTLEPVWTLGDAGLEVRELRDGQEAELTSARIFIDGAEVDAAGRAGLPSQNVLTYLVNRIGAPGGGAPYSMVAAVDPDRVSVFGSGGIQPGEIVVTEWLADDQGLAVGDPVELAFNVAGSDRRLEERTARFTVARVLPMDHPEAKPDWTPEFPGVSDNENCRDWDPGFAMDLDAIRDKDEDYWDAYKGTPKAFLRLPDGQEIWSNRFGEVTAVRFPGAVDPTAVGDAIRARLNLSDVGLQVIPVREQATAAVDSSMDFGSLFLSMSAFLVAAALVLAALLFLFGVERRSSQIGLLMAVGVPPKRVRRLFVVEALVLSVAGALVGLLGAVAYTKLALWGLSGGWSGAVAGAQMSYAGSPVSLAAGAVLTVFVAWLIVALASRRIARAAPAALLAGAGLGETGGAAPARARRWPAWVSAGCAVAGIGLAFAGRGAAAGQAPGFFFGSGFLVLVAGLAAMAAWLGSRRSGAAVNVWSLGMRNASRRTGRSLAVAGVMAAGVFLVVAVNAFRLSGTRAADRASGTGGFALYAETTLPVYEDLNSPEGQATYGLDDGELEGAPVVRLRQSDGDDASCLNLNRAQQPVVLGVDPNELASRGAFTFASGEGGWEALDGRLEDGAIPAVADQSTAMWALGKKLGDDLHYRGPGGEIVRVRLVGLVANSLLQGRVIISDENFVTLFPGTGGRRVFLVDTPPDRSGEVAAALTRRLRNRGAAVVPAASRLDEFNVVQNTYLGIFTVLGGLGLLLGTAGLAVVVARNVIERRGELGLLGAVGFNKKMVRQVVLGEHWFLHVGGVAIGATAALVAVWPAVTAPGTSLPTGLLAALVAAVLAGGIAFCWLAGTLALRGSLLEALRSE